MQAGKHEQTKTPKVMAVASSGGHWVQLLRLQNAFTGCEMIYVTAQSEPKEDLSNAKLHTIPDANRWNKRRLLALLPRLMRLVWTERPDVIISTGAAPGLLAMVFGRMIGCRCLWLDSIANAQELSLSGKLSKRVAHVTLSQWKDVAERENVLYRGAVL